MIKIHGTSQSTAPTKLRKAKSSGTSFDVSSSADTQQSAAQGATQTEATSVLSALIGLQSQGGKGAQVFAAAQDVLNSLGALQQKLLNGELQESDLQELKVAAALDSKGEAEPALENIYQQIRLRARVELAKLGVEE